MLGTVWFAFDNQLLDCKQLVNCAAMATAKSNHCFLKCLFAVEELDLLIVGDVSIKESLNRR